MTVLHYRYLRLFVGLTVIFGLLLATPAIAQKNNIAIALHGGAGTILKKNMTPEKEAAIRAKLEEALDAGYAVLEKGGSALKAVETTIMILEDSPLFNAGKGAVLTSEGHAELDASVMDGRTLNAGAIAGVKTVRNPILGALAVMTSSKHVMLSGAGAETFAQQQGLTLVAPDYFLTPGRKEQLQRMQKREAENAPRGQVFPSEEEDYKYGTVGCAALDADGNLAAGTSTGGMMNKRFGRIGDAPIIGAGTYANNETCAISCTGHGEYFIRRIAAYDVSALMEYKGYSLEKASKTVVNKKLKKMGGGGGMICVDKDGNVAMPFNTAGMYRAYRKANGEKAIMIYKKD